MVATALAPAYERQFARGIWLKYLPILFLSYPFFTSSTNFLSPRTPFAIGMGVSILCCVWWIIQIERARKRLRLVSMTFAEAAMIAWVVLTMLLPQAMLLWIAQATV